jgi:TatD DNase family protein
MKYYDSHAHLDLFLQKTGVLMGTREIDIETVSQLELQEISYQTSDLESFIKNHELIIQPTISTNNFYLNYHLFAGEKRVVFLLGSHPDMVGEDFDIDSYIEHQKKALDFIDSKNLIAKKQLVGIGEVGLDYFHVKTAQGQQLQREFFQTQIDLAVSLSLPLVIHCRDSFSDLFEILRQNPQIHGRFLIHCFTGGKSELEKVLEMGGFVAFGGVATYNSAKELQEAVKLCPMDRFTLETDLPFLSPIPKRGEVCLPQYIDYTAQKIAVLKTVSKEEVWVRSRETVKNIFGV